MKKRHILGAVFLVAFVCVAWYLSAPYVTLWRLRSAVETDDDEALREIVDFPRVRAGLTEDLQGVVGPGIEGRVEGPLAGLGRALGDAAVERIVEAYVSPEGIMALARGRDPTDPGAPPPEEPPEMNISRRGLDTFVVTTETPLGQSPEFVFAREGLVWRMVRIETGL